MTISALPPPPPRWTPRPEPWTGRYCAACEKEFDAESWKVLHAIALEEFHDDCCPGCPEDDPIEEDPDALWNDYRDGYRDADGNVEEPSDGEPGE